MAWDAGNSETTLATQLIEYINSWLANERYSVRLPREFVEVLRTAEKQSSGIQIIIGIERDYMNTHSYIPQSGPDAGSPILREGQQVGIIVKADKRNLGLEGVEAVMGVIKSIFACPGSTEERDDLISRGIYNLFESVEGYEVDPSGIDNEGEVVSQTLSLTCETEILIHG